MPDLDPTTIDDPAELVTDETRDAEADDATVIARADRPPTPEVEAAAEESAADVDPDVGEHYQEMAEKGAHVKGEGAIGG